MEIDARNRQIRKQNTKVGSRATLTTEGSYLSLEHNETKLRHFSLLLLYVPLCKRQSFEALIDLAFETLALFLAVECLYLLLPYTKLGERFPRVDLGSLTCKVDE